MNVSHGIGDHDVDVDRNRKAMARALGFDRLVYIRQVHGDKVLIINKKGLGNDMAALRGPRPEADAFVTDMTGLGLVIQVADCQPILLYDPEKKVVANVHSGWRGSVLNIIGRVIEAMQAQFGCQAKNLIVGVGPSLGPCCAEFINYRRELPETFWPYRDGANHFDFWAISKRQLIETGVLEDNIHISRICTRCRTDQFYSYRGEKVTGRFAAVIGLNPNSPD